MIDHDLAFDAMLFARDVHAKQRRKYTHNPYADHLAEVAGIVATVDPSPVTIATAWLHDSMEDQGLRRSQLSAQFGDEVSGGVWWLSDLEAGGNRAERKAASRGRLYAAPAWVQNIKVADLISNTASIVQHDPKFAVVYLDEKRALLEVLTRADERLLRAAWRQIGE